MASESNNSPQLAVSHEKEKLQQSLASQAREAFYNVLTPDDRELMSMMFDEQQLEAKISVLSPAHQARLLEVLKTQPEITKELIENIESGATMWQEIIDRHKDTHKQQENKQGSEEKTEIKSEKIERIENTEKGIGGFLSLSDTILSKMDAQKFPQLETWKQSAAEEIQKQDPNLREKVGPQEFERYVNAYALLQNAETITQTDPALKDALAQLQRFASGIDVFKSIESKKEAKLIDENLDKHQFLERDIQNLKASLLPDGEELKIEGNTVFSGDQVIEIGTNGPKKSIQRHGYKIDTTLDFTPNYKYQYDKQTLIPEYKKSIQTYHTAEQNLKDIDAKIKELETNIKSTDDDLNKEILSLELENILKNDYPRLKQEQETAKNKVLEYQYQANEIETQEKERLPNYQELQQQQDEQARDTLDFLNNMGLTYIPQSTLELLFTHINRSPEQYGFPREISLETGLGGTLTDRKAIKEGFFNLFSKLYEKMGVDTTGITVDKFINGTAGDQFKNQTFATRLEDPAGLKTKGGFNESLFVDFMLSNTQKTEIKQ